MQIKNEINKKNPASLDAGLPLNQTNYDEIPFGVISAI